MGRAPGLFVLTPLSTYLYIIEMNIIEQTLSNIKIMTCLTMLTLLAACGNKQNNSTTTTAEPVGPEFSADSAFNFCQQQCDFGPRIMNSEAHEQCAQWIAAKFREYGMEVTEQKAVLKGYDGTKLNSTNIIASYQPQAKKRILLCAHWDSRPWADNDPDEANWKTPVLAANDGASGVGVMLEIARLISTQDSTNTSQASSLNAQLGIDFICFDAEDWGTPQWSDSQEDSGDTWALGAQYWAASHHKGHKPQYGILLDMVGGQGATFYREGFSKRYANDIVNRVWQAAAAIGKSSYFPQEDGGYITDDHVPVNRLAGVPCIDIVPHYPDCEQSSFGPTWHTVNDDMQHLDRNTLKAVGQTIVQVLWSE